MRPRRTVRILATIAAAFFVATAFAGSGAAVELVDINQDDGDDALINIGGTGSAGDGGGGGGGGVDVGNDQANGGGSGSVSVSPDGANVDLGGHGAAGDREFGGGVSCTITAAPQAPDCTTDAPGGGGGGPQIDTSHDSSLNSEGGAGQGGVTVTSDQGGFAGEGEVAGSPDDGVHILVQGDGSVQGQGAGGGIHCDIPAGPPSDPASLCESLGGGGVPSPPGGLPSPPGGLPSPPGGLPSPPGGLPSPPSGVPAPPSLPGPIGGLLP